MALDKSFLIGASRSQLEGLAGSFTVVVSDALILEILTTGALDRCNCARRLVEVVKRFRIVESIPALLRYEMARQQSASPVLERAQNFDARLGDRICRWKLILAAREISAIQTWRNDVEESIKCFLQEAETIPLIFRDLATSNHLARMEAARAWQQRIAVDPGPVLELHGQMTDPRFPSASLLDNSWAFFRRLQVHFFATLEEFARQGPAVASVARSPRSRTALFNEVVDFDYRILGLLLGGLATFDKASADTFRTLSPTGTLLDQCWIPSTERENQTQ